MRLARFVLLLSFCTGCPAAIKPPQSPFPTARDAITRMRASVACGERLRGQGKIDVMQRGERLKPDVQFSLWRPAKLRMDAVISFGAALGTLTSNGTRFAFTNFRDRVFFVGEPSACNIARFTGVALPAGVIIDLLRGVAPVVRYSDPEATIRWDTHGYYIVELEGNDHAHEVIHLALHPDDMSRPWREQRTRVRKVVVTQSGYTLYDATLDGHATAKTAVDDVDAFASETALRPGPECTADVPRKVSIEVPESGDLRLTYDEVEWNPVFSNQTFEQMPGARMRTVPVTCSKP